MDLLPNVIYSVEATAFNPLGVFSLVAVTLALMSGFYICILLSRLKTSVRELEVLTEMYKDLELDKKNLELDFDFIVDEHKIELEQHRTINLSLEKSLKKVASENRFLRVVLGDLKF